MSSQQESQQDMDDSDALVSEFPPPPYYYTLASTLTPPPIPHDALIRSTKKAISYRNHVRKMEEEAEKRRFGEEEDAKLEEVNKTGVSISEVGGDTTMSSNDLTISPSKDILGGVVPDFGMNDDDDNIENDNGPVVAVFGDDCYVEDPTLVPVEDGCDDPKQVKDTVSRLNKDILQGFIKLLGDLVNQPLAHKKCRQGLLENIEVMLKECNKFREHQAREVLIETLETQLENRQAALKELNDQIAESDIMLEKLKHMVGTNSNTSSVVVPMEE